MQGLRTQREVQVLAIRSLHLKSNHSFQCELNLVVTPLLSLSALGAGIVFT